MLTPEMITPEYVAQVDKATQAAILERYDEAKFVETLLYVAGKLHGTTRESGRKLSKVLFFADHAHMRRFGTPITCAVYLKRRRGPEPRELERVIEKLVLDSGDLVIKWDEFLGCRLPVFVPTRPADTSVFSDDELATIDKIVADLAPFTALHVEELSRDDDGWRVADDNGPISYHRSWSTGVSIPTPGLRRMREDVAKRYGIAAP